MIRKILTKDVDTEVGVIINDKSSLFKFAVIDFGDRFSFALTPNEVDDLIENLILTRNEFNKRDGK